VGQVVPQSHRILIYVGGCLGLDSILLTAVIILRDLGVLFLMSLMGRGGGTVYLHCWWMLLMLLKGEGCDL